ncbi:1-(5-phosphoribosyl)-5-[(5-phosphoribosylamino)methylideneamino]imidazole-4-carboxamide isomerase [Candidatus Omnitrophota bacterium]
MIVMPAIDIIQGRVVRLYQGDFNKETSYSDDPLETAIRWKEKGASFLHIVDLDGARYGEVKNKELITRIINEVDIACEVGGGLRDNKDIEYFVEQGAERLVLGTKAFEDTKSAEGLIARFGKKIAIGIDFARKNRDVYITKTGGWIESCDLSPDVAAKKMQEIGVKTIVLTDISKDGMLEGPNIEKIKEILDDVDVSVIASGGISTLEDIRRLKEIGSKNLEGIIIGRALYEGKIGLEEAIKAAA